MTKEQRDKLDDKLRAVHVQHANTAHTFFMDSAMEEELRFIPAFMNLCTKVLTANLPMYAK